MKYNVLLNPHPKRPPKNDLDELSFFSASATNSRALASLSDMATATVYHFVITLMTGAMCEGFPAPVTTNFLMRGDSHHLFIKNILSYP